jgi:hypothetical protein
MRWIESLAARLRQMREYAQRWSALQHLWNIGAYAHSEPVELVLALISGVVGIWLALPLNSLIVVLAFPIMQDHTIESGIAAWFLFLAWFTVRSVGKNSTRQRHIAAVCTTITWFFWTGFMAQAGFWTLGTPFYVSLSLIASWVLLRQEEKP